MPPRKKPSHNPPCSRSALKAVTGSSCPSLDEGICWTTFSPRTWKRPACSLAIHRSPALSCAIEATAPDAGLTGTKRSSFRYPNSNGVETQILPAWSWKREFGRKSLVLPLIIATCPLLNRFKLSRVASHIPPSLSAKTDCNLELDKPWFTENVEIAKSRKRSRPFPVATQILPSRSSKSTVQVSPERPCDSPNTSVLPWCTCTSPSLKVPIHRLPSRSRSILRPRIWPTLPGIEYSSVFPSTKRWIPPFQPTSNVPSLSSPKHWIPSGSPARE